MFNKNFFDQLNPIHIAHRLWTAVQCLDMKMNAGSTASITAYNGQNTFVTATLPYFVLFTFIWFKFKKFFGLSVILIGWILFIFSTGMTYATQLWNPFPAPLIALAAIYMLFTTNFSIFNKRNLFKITLIGFLLGLIINFHISFGIGFALGTLIFILWDFLKDLLQTKKITKILVKLFQIIYNIIIFIKCCQCSNTISTKCTTT